MAPPSLFSQVKMCSMKAFI